LTRAGALVACAGTAHLLANVRGLRRPLLGSRAAASISVLVPARNEASRIGRCVEALRRQFVTEILVLDDGSTDDTASVAAGTGDTRIRVLSGSPPPAGWLGKPHACRQLADAANGELLAFVDADVVVSPGAVQAVAALLEELGVDLISAHPRELAQTWSERLVQPLLQWSVLTFLPLRLAQRSRRGSLTAANGQFLVVRRTAYERCGGHVPDAVLDDLALARALKRAGGRCAWVDGSRLAVCRMYSGWAGVREGYEKSLWEAFGTPAGAAAVSAVLGVAYVVPTVAMLRGSAAGAVGYLAGVAGRLDALAHPLSIAVLLRLVAGSVIKARRGRLTWAGRAVQARAARSS
jgi:hypothetical protein